VCACVRKTKKKNKNTVYSAFRCNRNGDKNNNDNNKIYGLMSWRVSNRTAIVIIANDRTFSNTRVFSRRLFPFSFFPRRKKKKKNIFSPTARRRQFRPGNASCLSTSKRLANRSGPSFVFRRLRRGLRYDLRSAISFSVRYAWEAYKSFQSWRGRVIRLE
jgi:hypothetical protein